MQPRQVQLSTGIVKGHHKGRNYNFLSRVQLARFTGLPRSKLGHQETSVLPWVAEFHLLSCKYSVKSQAWDIT